MLEDRVGLLDAARLELVQSRVVDYMGMLDEGDDEELTTEEPWA